MVVELLDVVEELVVDEEVEVQEVDDEVVVVLDDEVEEE